MKSLEQELVNLLERACLECGFCSMPEDDYVRLINAQQLTADEFAIAVLKGDGHDPPEADLEWFRRLKRLFVEHFGEPSVSVRDFEEGE